MGSPEAGIPTRATPSPGYRLVAARSRSFPECVPGRRYTRNLSASAVGAQSATGVGPLVTGAFGPEVASVCILLIRHGRRLPAGEHGDGLDEAGDIVLGRGQSGAGAHGARYVSPVAAANGLLVLGSFIGVQLEETKEVRVSAKAAVSAP